MVWHCIVFSVGNSGLRVFDHARYHWDCSGLCDGDEEESEHHENGDDDDYGGRWLLHFFLSGLLSLLL